MKVTFIPNILYDYGKEASFKHKFINFVTDLWARCRYPTRLTMWQSYTSNSPTTPCADAGSETSAARFCRAFDEVRQFFRFRTTMNQSMPLAGQRTMFCQRLDHLKALVLRASPQGERMSSPQTIRCFLCSQFWRFRLSSLFCTAN